MNKSSAHIVQPSPGQWFNTGFIITSNKCFSLTIAEPGRGLTIKVRETLMRQDYDDGIDTHRCVTLSSQGNGFAPCSKGLSAARRWMSGWVAVGTLGCRCHSERHHILSFVPLKGLEISKYHKIHFVSNLVRF